MLLLDIDGEFGELGLLLAAKPRSTLKNIRLV